MGTLYYGDSGTPIGIEDRALAHLKIAITTKLRRGESFTLSWQHTEEQPRGRSTLWLHPSIPLRFVFDEPEAPELSRTWIEDLMRSANSTGGIRLVPEHLDTDPIQALPDQPVRVGADVQEIDVDKRRQRHRPRLIEQCARPQRISSKEDHMGATDDTTAGHVEIERWWPHLSIEAKHRLLAELDAAIDAETVAEIEALTGGMAPDRLTLVEQRYVITQIEAVD